MTIQSLDRFHIVRHHLLSRVNHPVERVPVSFHVRDERLDGGSRTQSFHLFYGLVPYFGTPVFQLITVDGGEHSVFNLHELDGFGHAAGFVFVVFRGTAGGYRAEGTTTGANVAQNHEGGGATAPALTHVRTVAAFADSMKLVLIYQGTHLGVLFARWQLHA